VDDYVASHYGRPGGQDRRVATNNDGPARARG